MTVIPFFFHLEASGLISDTQKQKKKKNAVYYIPKIINFGGKVF